MQEHVVESKRLKMSDQGRERDEHELGQIQRICFVAWENEHIRSGPLGGGTYPD